MLYFRGNTAEQLAAQFIRAGRTTDKRALRHMRQVAKMVMEQSIANSPVDWKGPKGSTVPGHELEKSHRIAEQRAGNGRIVATVEVGGMVGGVNVDLYAMWLHESFDWQLGKASRLKMMQSAKNKVGPLFLERALKENEAEFDDLLDEIMEDLL